MSRVFGAHTVELRPGVEAEDFEKFVIVEVYPLAPEGVEWYLAKGDKGERAGKYLSLFVMESVETRDRIFGAPGEPSAGLSEEMKQMAAKFGTFCTSSFTDYVVVGK